MGGEMCSQIPLQGGTCCPPASSAFSRQPRPVSGPATVRDVRCAGLAISARCTALMDNTHSRASHGVPETPRGFARPASLSDFFLHHIFPLPSFFPRWRSPIRTFSLTELHHGACFRRTPAATWESQLSRTAFGETRRHHSGGGSDGTQ